MKVNDALEILEKDKVEKKYTKEIKLCVSTLREVLEEFVDVLDYTYYFYKSGDVFDYYKCGFYVEITNRNLTKSILQFFQPKVVVFIHEIYFEFEKSQEDYKYKYNHDEYFQIQERVKVAKFLLHVIKKLKLNV
jgi:hypothetical protein